MMETFIKKGTSKYTGKMNFLKCGLTNIRVMPSFRLASEGSAIKIMNSKSEIDLGER